MSPTHKLLSAYRSYRARPRDRGAVIVEAAIAIPMLLLVIMGSVEFGFGWEARSATASAVRTGLLRAASIGDQPETDMRILQSIIGEVGADNIEAGRVEWVVIFERQPGVDDATRIADCEGGGGGNCVVYRADVLRAISNDPNPEAYRLANFTSADDDDTTPDIYDCAAAPILDANWCAGRRTASGDIEIGVALSYQHQWFTGIFPFDAPNFQEHAVSSTFLEEGSDISPTGVAVPTSVGQVFTSDFGPGSDLTGFTNTTGSNPVKVENPNTVNGGGSTTDVDLLGRFGNDTIVLGIATPQAEAAPVQVCVSFTLWIIGSWDGNHAGNGPDSFTLDIGNDGTPESSDTYDHGTQPDDFGYGDHANTARSVPMLECITHHGSTLDISFAAVLTQTSLNNESWAISDLNVNVAAV